MKLYQTVARELEELIRGGTLRPGDQLPSVRSMRKTRGVSPATVLHAYSSLEAMRLVEARSRSGYYVSLKPRAPPVPRPSTPTVRSTRVVVSDLVFDTLEASRDRRVVPLGSAFPSPTLFPWKKLARHLGSGARRMDPWSTVESLPPGNQELRRQIARRYLKLGMTVGIEQIVITAGALEALNLALLAVTRRGDTIAIESPTFYGCLQAAERLSLKVIEIPTDPVEGVDLEALGRAIARHPIRACWLMTTLQHPTGATVPVEKKRRLVELLARHQIPLIEDDAYGDLQFASTPAVPAKAFDTIGNVMHCGSFSKCLAPGYRLGWVSAGRFAPQVSRIKVESSLSTSLPIQYGISQMLQLGGYESHLTTLREALESQQASALQSLQRHFPTGYRVAQPGGGYFLWIECAGPVDSLEVHRLALNSGITIAPGPMFSARQQYRNFIRLNCGHPWGPKMDAAVAKIGGILRQFG
jgi:DNA-binding transcriptional MocR family regulator